MKARKGIIFLLLTIIIVPLVAFLIYVFLSRPQKSGILHFDNINGKATIEYSKLGIPYIEGETEEATMFALGVNNIYCFI